MKIGLTGSIACGKSTVASYLRALGIPVVDADAISRALTAPGGEALPAIRQAFGDHIFDGGTLNRRKLGDIVFADPAQRAWLEGLLHPIIIEKIQLEMAAHETGSGLVFADVPLLYECGMQSLFDAVWVVSASRRTQIERLYLRNGLGESDAAARIDAQMPLSEKIMLANAVISTEGEEAEMHAQVDALLRTVRRNA